MSEHAATFTSYKGTRGVVCSCGYTLGGCNELAIKSWFSAHLAFELLGIPMRTAYDLAVAGSAPVPTTEARR